jgi:hypothetical protein
MITYYDMYTNKRVYHTRDWDVAFEFSNQFIGIIRHEQCNDGSISYFITL